MSGMTADHSGRRIQALMSRAWYMVSKRKLTCRVAVMLVAPPEQAGVVGAVLQTSMQASTVIALSIQAGIMTIRPGGIEDIINVRASWYFQLGWLGLWLIGFLALYRP